jgi:MFS family permease
MLYVLLFLFGVFNSVEILTFVLAREVADRRISGTVIALINMIVMLGGMVFQPLIGKILDLQWNGSMLNGVRLFSAHDYRVALTVIPAGLFLSFILALCVQETHAKLQH